MSGQQIAAGPASTGGIVAMRNTANNSSTIFEPCESEHCAVAEVSFL
jgi:hypothetical protein